MDPLLQRFLSKHPADLGLAGSEAATVDNLTASDKDVLVERLLKYSDDAEKTKFRSAFTLVLVDGDALNVSWTILLSTSQPPLKSSFVMKQTD